MTVILKLATWSEGLHKKLWRIASFNQWISTRVIVATYQPVNINAQRHEHPPVSWANHPQCCNWSSRGSTVRSTREWSGGPPEPWWLIDRFWNPLESLPVRSSNSELTLKSLKFGAIQPRPSPIRLQFVGQLDEGMIQSWCGTGKLKLSVDK